MASSTSNSEHVNAIVPLKLADAADLLKHNYLALESGYGVTSDGMWHVAATTYMKGCSGAMVDWWFGYIHRTEEYKLWHPRDHVFSDWIGPRDNTSSYVGGHHLVHEYIGGELSKFKISFVDPSKYFGHQWRKSFQAAGYSTAICARVGSWIQETDSTVYMGHLIHLIKEEPDGCRMRSRFWLGDIDGIDNPQQRQDAVPPYIPPGLLKHCVEEMAILATILPDMYDKLSRKAM